MRSLQHQGHSEITPVVHPRRQKRPRLPGGISPADEATLPDEGYTDRLSEAVSEIKRVANGRTCGGCLHYRSGWCAEQVSISPSNYGNNLRVMYPNAVACAKHAEVMQ